MKIPPTHILLMYYYYYYYIIIRAFIPNYAHKVPPGNLWYVVRIYYII